MKLKKIALWTAGVCAGIVAVAALALWATTYHPEAVQPERMVCAATASVLEPGQTVKVLSWNVQYMAGKQYVFFYDLFDGSGPDERPSPGEITKTFNEVARVIRSENPDIILIQEIDDGSKRTDYENQLARLLSLLPAEYSCYSDSYYWKASFVPHPRIMGKVGMKLAVISKYKIGAATRYQLELIPADPVTKQLNFKRAVLEVRFPVQGAKDFVVMTTHLDAFAQGSNTMERQVAQVRSLLDGLSAAGNPWIIGGDFNLLPPGPSYTLLPSDQRVYFNETTELSLITDRYRSVPSLSEINGPARDAWFTHFPNDPAAKNPDRAIDYLFMSDTVKIGKHYIRQKDARAISDHFPLVAEIVLP